MTHRLWNRMPSRLAVTLGLALALWWTTSTTLAAPAKPTSEVAAKAKNKDKAAAKGAKKTAAIVKPGKVGKSGKSGKSGKTAGKGAKTASKTPDASEKDTKATSQISKAASKDAKSGSDPTTAKGAKGAADKTATDKTASNKESGNKESDDKEGGKAGKSKGKKGLAAKAPPVDPTAAMEEEVNEFENDAKDKNRPPSSSPLLYVFVLFIVGCVAGYLYMKKKQELKASGADGNDFTSSHGEAFGSNLSSLNADSRRSERLRSPGNTAADAGTSKKSSWKSGKIFTSLGEQLKTSPKRLQEADGKGLASQGTEGSGLDSRAASAKSVPKKPDAPSGPSRAASAPPAGKLPSPAVAARPMEAPIVSSSKPTKHSDADDEHMTHVGTPPPIDPAFDVAAAASKEPVLTDADWIGWDKIEAEEFWYRVKKIDQDGIDHGDDAYISALKKAGFSDRTHYERVKDAYRARFPAASDPGPMMNASTRAAEEKARAASSLDPAGPIAGVSLEVYANVMARRTALAADDREAFASLLSERGLSMPQFEDADRGWQARLSASTDSQAKAEYDRILAAAQHQPDQPMTREEIEPCSFERYIEVREAQNCWSQQGRDIAGMLQVAFQLTVADWSVIAQYWSTKYLASPHLTEDEAAFTKRYREKFGYVKAS